MKAIINYLKGHKQSEALSKECFDSLEKYNWTPALQPGITPNNWNSKAPWIYNGKLLKDGRINQMISKGGKEKKIGVTKMSCFANHINFWKEVIKRDEPMAFIEHDIVAIGSLDISFDEYLILNAETAFSGQPKFSHVPKISNYKVSTKKGIHNLAPDWPLIYNKDTDFYGAAMVPGTASYAVTPKGAKRLLDAYNKYGFEQSDYFINSYTVKIQYIIPSPCTFNKEYITTSWG